MLPNGPADGSCRGSALSESTLILGNQLLIEAPQVACRVTESYVPHGANNCVLVASLVEKKEKHPYNYASFKQCRSEGLEF